MGFFIFGVILLVVGAILFVACRRYAREHPDESVSNAALNITNIVLCLSGLVMLALSAIYFQDPGESVVLRHFTGTLSGISSESGAHIKSPFDACVRYDVRNNTVTFVGDGTEDQVHGGTAIGPQITFQDKEGVTGNLDVVVRYSIDPLAVKELYANYLSQENFVTKVVAQDVRSISRQIPGEYGTLALFNSRAEAEQAIFAALEKKWVNQPITLEAVNLQEIRYSEDIKQRYDDAQAARVAVDKAQAEQDAAEIQAETARIAAQGQADANAILTESLSEEILRQRYIDALQKGGAIYVVPEGSSPIVGVAPPVSAPAAPQPQ